MNGTDINDTSLKTRYPKLSSDTDSTFLGGLVLEKSIVDPTYGFENCRNLSTFKMFLLHGIDGHWVILGYFDPPPNGKKYLNPPSDPWGVLPPT